MTESQHKPRAFNPPTLPSASPSYAQVSTTPLLPTSHLITLAGQIDLSAVASTEPIPFLTQVRAAYNNVNVALKAAGASARDIVHVRHYIVQNSGNEALDKIDIVERGWGELWVEFLDKEGAGHRPPDTVLGVAGLAKRSMLYEVEVWAVVNHS